MNLLSCCTHVHRSGRPAITKTASVSKMHCKGSENDKKLMHVCCPKERRTDRKTSPAWKVHEASLVYVAGLIRLRTALMRYSGNELTATMSATFHANRVVITKDKSKYSGRNAILIT